MRPEGFKWLFYILPFIGVLRIVVLLNYVQINHRPLQRFKFHFALDETPSRRTGGFARVLLLFQPQPDRSDLGDLLSSFAFLHLAALIWIGLLVGRL